MEHTGAQQVRESEFDYWTAGEGITLLHSTIPVLDSKFSSRVAPFYCPFHAGDLAGTALQTTRVFHHHLIILFVVRIEVARTDRKTIPYPASRSADLLVYPDMAFFVCLEGIYRKFFFNFHGST
jgi:hypothetical protein